MIDIEKLFPGLTLAIIKTESGDSMHPEGNDSAIGDVHLSAHAYGPLQIRKPYVDDVNRVFGEHHVAHDCLGNRQLSIDIFQKYMTIYATQKHLGRAPTAQDIARMHNGGPAGYKNPNTLGYWRKVQSHL